MTRAAFLFDLDGTLIDSRRSIAGACNHALTAMGRAPLSEAAIAAYVGYGARSLVKNALRAADGAEVRDAEIDEALAFFVAFYAAHPIDGTTWMAGAREALDSLRGTPLGLVTNKARVVTVPVLRALGVEHLFGVVVAGGDAPLKPDPAPFLLATRALGVAPAATWVIGDGIQDVRGGKAAGCRTAAVLGGFHVEGRLRAERPDVVLASLADLAELTEGARPV